MKKSRKPPFEDSGRSHGTVILNWVGTPKHEFKWYGKAFHAAGKSLVKQLENDPGFRLDGYPPDSFKAVPIVYMYGFAMELYLKSIVIEGGEVLPLRGEQRINLKDLFSTHKLRSILDDVERIFKAFGWDWDFELPHFHSFADFRSVIQELATVYPKLRYPTKQDGESSTLDSHFRFNLFEFCEVLDPLFPILDGIAYAAHEELQLEQELYAQTRQAELENADIEGSRE